jgi:hypothetical protein
MQHYFAPEAVCITRTWPKTSGTRSRFGRNNARWFDQFGSRISRGNLRRVLSGYGASWPSYYGSVAMTYEQASSRGLAMTRRTDGVEFHFRDTVRHHFVASISTAEAAAARRKELLEAFYRYRQTAIEEGAKEPVREYVFPRRGDTAAVDKLADVGGAGVEVKRRRQLHRGRQASPPAACGELAQPKRLIRTPLDPEVKMEEGLSRSRSGGGRRTCRTRSTTSWRGRCRRSITSR